MPLNVDIFHFPLLGLPKAEKAEMSFRMIEKGSDLGLGVCVGGRVCGRVCVCVCERDRERD